MGLMVVAPSLPRLLSLDEDVKVWEERLEQAATIAGIPLKAGISDLEIKRLASNRTAAHGRAEWIMRWLLEKLKTEEGRQKSRSSTLTFVLLKRLLLFIPPATSARLLNVNEILSIVKNYLEETAEKLESELSVSNQNMDSGSSVTLDSQPTSKKRKRSKAEPDTSSENTKDSHESARNERDNLIGLGSFINQVIDLGDSLRGDVDSVASEHLRSVTRTNTSEAAEILRAWLRSLSALCQSHEIDFNPNPTSQAVFRTHSTIIHIWESRSLEVDDDSGSSAQTFSKACLVPTVSVYAQIGINCLEIEGSPYQEEMKDSLQLLLARHVFVPGRVSFSTSRGKKTTTFSVAKTRLYIYLLPLKAEIVRLVGQDKIDASRKLVLTLPLLLDQAIKLCPQSSSKQKTADAVWIETIVATLSSCAGEPIPYDEAEATNTDSSSSPLEPMLRIVSGNQINLSTEFVESLLVGYSGLNGLDLRTELPVRWGLVTILLQIAGNVFLKEKPIDKNDMEEIGYTSRNSPYVEALVRSMANAKWDASSPQNNFLGTSANSPPHLKEGTWRNTREQAVTQLLVPLMRAYASARNMNGFLDLWFRELRKIWAQLGGRGEHDMLWASEKLRQEFQVMLETSLTPARINERLVEYITPIKILVDEISRAIDSPKWAAMSTTAPASVTLVMMDTILQSIESAEILQSNLPTWKALKDLIILFANAELKDFGCSSKIWSILTQIHVLSLRVDGEKAFQEQMVSFSTSGVLDRALSAIDHVRPDQVDGHEFEGAREAYRFVTIVSSDLLDFPALEERAEHYISTANNFLLHNISRLNPRDVFTAELSKKDIALSNRLRNSLTVLVQYPRALSVFSSHERCSIFETLNYYAVVEYSHPVRVSSGITFQLLLKALTEAVLSSSSASVKDDFITTLISMFKKSESYGNPRLTHLALDVFLRLPLTSVSRKEREAILDKLSAMFKPGLDLSPFEGDTSPSPDGFNNQGTDIPPFYFKLLSLMIRLMELRNPTSELCTEATQIWNISRFFDKETFQGDDARLILQDLETLFNVILKQALVDATPDRKEKFAASFAKQVATNFQHPLELSRLAVRFLLKTWVSIMTSIGDILGPLAELGTRYHDILITDIGQMTKGKANDVQQWAILRAFSEYPFEAFSNDRMTELKSLRARIQKEHGNSVELIRATAPATDSEGLIESMSEEFRDENISPQDHGLLIVAFETSLRTTRTPKKLSLISKLLRDDGVESMPGDLQMLHLLIKSLTHDESAVITDKGALLVKLVKQLQSAVAVGRFGAVLSCINTILRTKPWLVSQHGVDTLLSTLASLASPKSKHLPKEYAPFIYLRLCQTMTNLVLLHRKNLGGRMHLLVPLLQNLLTCLFKPHRAHGSRSTVLLPSWLYNTPSTLTASHATSYSRLLSTLCSPTSSSTSSHRRHAELVDANKQARVYAGQYVPYVLMHYCSLQLSGSMEASVREGLRPGIWDMMGVVSIEGMRGMNVGMGRDERAVWGVLYAEWLRVGKGR